MDMAEFYCIVLLQLQIHFVVRTFTFTITYNIVT
jgi:hypothetical protein